MYCILIFNQQIMEFIDYLIYKIIYNVLINYLPSIYDLR